MFYVSLKGLVGEYSSAFGETKCCGPVDQWTLEPARIKLANFNAEEGAETFGL